MVIDPEALSTAVIRWFYSDGRKYPWRETTNPFHVLLAEVLLRMTGAWKAEEPYRVLASRYSGPSDMLAADSAELGRLFLPLGLHHRAELLMSISKEFVARFGGIVPSSYGDLVAIKGIGQYTANSILCLAFNQKRPLVDGSVSRLLCRCVSFRTTKSAYADRELWQLVDSMLPCRRFREFSLGLLDIAALHCRHPRPICTDCPLAGMCAARSLAPE